MRRKEFESLRLGKPRRVTRGLTNHEHPAVSPDGRWLAYYAGDYGSIEILVCGLDGRLARRASPFSGNSTQAAFAPDGSRLAYRHQYSSEAKWELWETHLLLPLEARTGGPPDLPGRDGAMASYGHPGTDPHPLLADPEWDYKHPVYSPDGSRLVYFSDEGSVGVFHLWLLDMPTGERHQLTFGDTANHCHPAFSPDGTHVAFHAYEGTDLRNPTPVTNLYELDLHTGDILQLTDRDDQDKHPFYLTDDVLTFHHERNLDGRRQLRALHLRHGLETALSSGGKNDKHPFPWWDAKGRPYLAWASKKLGPEREGELHTYDIFIAPFQI
jgi:hypothetical protein